MGNRTAEIKTNKGTIKFELLEKEAPKTTENFRLLAEKGFYDGVIFHRVIEPQGINLSFLRGSCNPSDRKTSTGRGSLNRLYITLHKITIKRTTTK